MKKIIAAALVAAYMFVPAWGQTENEPDTAEIESFDEVLISAQRLGESRRNTSSQIEVINAKQIALAQQPTLGEVLGQTGQVFVQKSQLGGGSPVLRGFEASRVLLVMDGVRLNNATYRAGHLQDIVTIDPFILERTEIYFGSGSTLYGSDALGGVIYLKTKSPVFTDKLKVNPTALLRYGSAGNAFTANAGLTLSSKSVSWLFNVSYNKFDDLTVGKGKNYSGIDTFGLRRHYVVRENGVDVMKSNSNPYKQIGTGYQQNDIFSKLAIKHGKWVTNLNLQASLSPEVPRYDRLNQYRNGVLRFAEWDYSPQNRYLAALQSEFKPSDKVSHKFSASFQRTEVGRATRGLNNPVKLTQSDDVNMWALNYDNVITISSKLRIQSGVEVVYNKVMSTATEKNIESGEIKSSKETRYADSFANSFSQSAFASAVYEIIPGDFIVNAGVRLSYYKARAAFTQNNFWGLNYGEANVENVVPVFNAGAVKSITPNLGITVNFSSGYRNPNIDDLTKLFESEPGVKYIVPNTQLKAEQTRTIDLGLRYNVKNRINMEAGVYRSAITNLLIDNVSSLNGSDSVFYNGQNTRVYQMSNAASGFVRGVYFGGKVKIVDGLFGDVYYASTFGRYKRNNSASAEPLDHIAPDHGRAGLRYVKSNWQAEFFMLFNGRKIASEYSPSGEDNVSQAPNGQNPAWQTYNIRGSYNLKNYSFTLAVENFMDLHYRPFASGTSAPGRNIVVSARISL